VDCSERISGACSCQRQLLCRKKRNDRPNAEAVGLVSDQAISAYQHDARIALSHFDHLLNALRVHPVIGEQHLAILRSAVDVAENEIEVFAWARTRAGSPLECAVRGGVVRRDWPETIFAVIVANDVLEFLMRLRQDTFDAILQIGLVVVDWRYYAYELLGHQFSPVPLGATNLIDWCRYRERDRLAA